MIYHLIFLIVILIIIVVVVDVFCQLYRTVVENFYFRVFYCNVSLPIKTRIMLHNIKSTLSFFNRNVSKLKKKQLMNIQIISQ